MTITDVLFSHRDSAGAGPSRPTGLRAELRARRAAWLARRRLEQELAAYTTAADRNDLNALLDQTPDAEAVVVRDILNRRPIEH
jgi:hypothetical protein